MSRLLLLLTFNSRSAHVITTNYDRLIEIAAELAGLPIDTGFSGHHYGRYDPQGSRESLYRFVALRRSPWVKRHIRPHLALYKPHGSLDWYHHSGEPVACWAPVDAPRLMITPGSSKYRRGYESPFDRHRARANDAIERATGFLIIGYGFNDDHLETALRAKLSEGRPCVLLTHTPTANAERLIASCPSILALSRAGNDGEHSTRCDWKGRSTVLAGSSAWSLDHFISEVLT